jgi:DNA-binding CsgD family transcriptional regulator
MSQEPWLLIRGLDPSVWAYPVTDGAHRLGRGSECEVRLSHTSVSRVHARLEFRDGLLSLEDLQSRNGTFVNQSRVSECSLAVGDELRVAAVVLDVVASLQSCFDEQTSADPIEAGRLPSVARQLSDAQQRVLRLILQGLSEKEVAARLHLSPHTVHTHVKNVYQALQVHSRGELIANCAGLR